MKTRLFLFPLAVAIALAWTPAAQAEDIYIRVEFMRGVSGPLDIGLVSPIASLSSRSAMPQSVRRGDDSEQTAGGIGEELTRLYRLDRVYELNESMFQWTAGSGRLPGLFVLERETFRIDLEPTSVRPKRIKLRLVVSRVLNKAGDLEKLLSTSLSASFDDPVVAGFSHAGQPYFLSVLATRSMPAPGSQGPPTGQAEAAPPLPVRRVDPKVPEGVDASVLEGEVVLKVTIDDQGKVSDIQVLKSLQPDVDRETVKAVGEWEFEPARRTAGQGPATFIMSFRFNPPRRGPRGHT